MIEHSLSLVTAISRGIKDRTDTINQDLLKLPSLTTRCYLVMTKRRLSHWKTLRPSAFCDIIKDTDIIKDAIKSRARIKPSANQLLQWSMSHEAWFSRYSNEWVDKAALICLVMFLLVIFLYTATLYEASVNIDIRADDRWSD